MAGLENGALAAWLAEEEISAVALVPGMLIDRFLLQLAETPRVQTIIATHEGAAGFIADGYARATRKLGVCFGIAGPGASNMLTAAITATADDSPVLFITGNVPDHLLDTGTFQDGGPGGTNDAGFFRQVLRYSAAVPDRGSLMSHLRKAGAEIRRLPTAPAHLCVPYDVQDGERSLGGVETITLQRPPCSDHQVDIDRVLPLLAAARKPVLLAGPRAQLPDASEALRTFAETYEIPVATTLSAKGLLPETHRLSLGNFGYAGSRRANDALLSKEPDLLLILGADLNERDSLCWDARLKPQGRTVMRIDPKQVAYKRALKPEVDLAIDCATALRSWTELSGTALLPLARSSPQRREWVERLTGVPREYDSPASAETNYPSVPLDQVIKQLRRSLPDDAVLVLDAGLQRVFAGHYWLAPRPHSFFSACGLAPMGWAIGAAIGIKLARPASPVVVVTGDGCMRTHGFEIATMARSGIPVIVVVCNNQAYGSIHRRFKSHQTAGAMTLLSNVDWPSFASALGADQARAGTLEELSAAISRALEATHSDRPGPRRPFVVEVVTPLTQGIASPIAAPAAVLTVKPSPVDPQNTVP